MTLYMRTTKWDRLSVSNQTFTLLAVAFSYVTKWVLYRLVTESDYGLNGIQSTGAYTILVGASLLIACIGLWRGRIIPALVTMLVTDLWLIANILYHEANAVLINWHVILIADNLRGFEGSILVYLHWWLFIIPAVTAAVVTFLVQYRNELKPEEGQRKQLGIYVVAALCVYAAGFGLKTYGNHVYDAENADKWRFNKEQRLFIQTHTPVAHIAYTLWEGIQERVLHAKAVMPLSDEEKALLATIYTDSVAPAEPTGHLVYFLIESFESWALTAKDAHGNEVCEHLNAYIRNHDLLLCTNVLTQQKHGRSGDGQLITQTGMLPLSTGITCTSHGGNVYPNLAHFYPNGMVLNSYPGVWNQKVTTYSYGFKRLREPRFMTKGTDSLIVSWALEELQKAVEPTCLLGITINTHAPFTSVPATMEFGDEYSSLESDYLQTVHYMDRHLGRFLAWADTAAVMQDATIVITADHNHFPVGNGKGLCPLLIRSPRITHKTAVRHAWQMDIFPTVLHAIGQSDYAWHGFGIDLLDPTAQRRLSPEQAYELSDKMIRTDYFRKKE